ncbi:hypothetical protein GUI12_02460 [Anaplasmataceae bacterium AB001_6]|nr:hypothetical protein GUI12_02460 [Anaplasmataceae bacterium AB001_6]
MSVKNINILDLKKSLFDDNSNENKILLDVRSKAEHDIYGTPDYDKKLLIEINVTKPLEEKFQSGFTEKFLEQNISKDVKIFVICKSGVRSKFVCTLLQNIGYDCFNVQDGFDNGTENCWKANLPVKHIK